MTRKPDQLPVPDMLSHPFHWLEMKFRKVNFFMLGFSLVPRHKWSFHFSGSLVTVCSSYLCDSLRCADWHAEYLAPAPAARDEGWLFSTSRVLCSANCWEKQDPGALKFISHLSIFGFSTRTWAFLCEICYCTLHSDVVWINLLIFRKN